MAKSKMPKRAGCPIGSLGLHTYNAERTECIWCGPGRLAWQPGRWVPVGGGQAWSADATETDEQPCTVEVRA